MTRIRAVFGQAVEAHREAVAQLRAARTALDVERSGDSATDRAALADRARRAAGRLAPGWLGADWADTANLPVGRDATAAAPVPVRIGVAEPGDDPGYPAVVPLLGAGHLAVDASPEPFAGVVLRLVAAAPAGLLRVCWLGAGLPPPFRPLRAAGLLIEADPDTALAAADRQLHHVAAAVRAGQDPAGLPYLLLVAAQPLPPARLRPLAEQGPAGRLHLLLAGQAAPLPHTVAVRSAIARHPDTGPDWASPRPTGAPSAPPGVAADGAGTARGAWVTVSYGEVTTPAVRLDPVPPHELITAVCRRLAGSLRPGFGQLVPARRWAERSTSGLRTPIGVGPGGVAELVCAGRTAHWLLAGTPRAAGAVAVTALYGLATRYSPDALAMYLLDATGRALFAEFAPSRADPSWLPHARHVGTVDAADGLTPVLAALVAEVAERRRLLDRSEHTDSTATVSVVDRAMPRILVAVAGADLALAAAPGMPGGRGKGDAMPRPGGLSRGPGPSPVQPGPASRTHQDGEAVPAAGPDGGSVSTSGRTGASVPRMRGGDRAASVEAMVADLAATGATVGVHLLVSAERTVAPVFGRLPGRLTVSDVDGTAVLAEQTVRLIDPYAEPMQRARLREALWRARTPGSAPPQVSPPTESTSLAGE